LVNLDTISRSCTLAGVFGFLVKYRVIGHLMKLAHLYRYI